MQICHKLEQLAEQWGCTTEDMLQAWSSNSYALKLLDRSFTEFRELTSQERTELEIHGPAYAFKIWRRGTIYFVYCVPQSRDGQVYKHPRIKSKAGRLRMLQRIAA